MSEQHPPAAPQTTDPSRGVPPSPHGSGLHQAVPPSDAGAQHPTTPPARRMHVGAIIAVIAGGMLLLGLTFASGAAVGWWLGAHHGAGWSQIGPGHLGGPGSPHGDERQLPGQPDANDQPDS